MKTAAGFEASPKACKNPPKKLRQGSFISEVRRNLCVKIMITLEKTQGRKRGHHHLPCSSPDTLHSFALARIFNLKFNIAKESTT